MKTLWLHFLTGWRAIAHLFLLNMAILPFGLVLNGLKEPEPTRWGVLLSVPVFCGLVAWLGYIFPKITRVCWRPDQLRPLDPPRRETRRASEPARDAT